MKEVNDFLLSMGTADRPPFLCPFSNDTTTYATNNHYAIAIPNDQLTLTYPDHPNPPDVERVFARATEQLSPDTAMICVSDLAKELSKARMEADKWMVSCPECNGNGEVTFDYIDRNGSRHEHDCHCPECEGDGQVEHRQLFPRVVIRHADRTDDFDDPRMAIEIGHISLSALNAYRLLMVALAKGITHIELKASTDKQYAVTTFGPIRLLFMQYRTLDLH